jgi:DNA (cytosine-5)-methyltransferase 1
MANLFSDKRLTIKQSFAITAERQLEHTLTIRDQSYLTASALPKGTSRVPSVAWVQSYLRGAKMRFPPSHRTLRAADLFCGSGGLTTGLKLACRTLGFELEMALACDADLQALEIYRTNHGPWFTSGQPVERLVNFHISGRGDDATWSTWPTLLEPHLAGYLASLDVVVAGPPCQGHSNLNNHTRRNDQRNLLYLTTVAFVVATGAKLCIVENVPEVLNDSLDVVRTARALLVKSGYRINDAVLTADSFGAPQKRRRHFLVAVRNAPFEFDLAHLAAGMSIETKVTVKQAIADLMDSPSGTPFDLPANLSAENKKRIDWLFRNNAYELPDKHRPDCHKNGHTYPSVYGRMKWDEPAQTVTTGFLTPGRGRFIHPGLKRTITPHEAARIQSFPDTYEFIQPGQIASRGLLAKVIGDAVPPLLARAVATVGLAMLLNADGSA